MKLTLLDKRANRHRSDWHNDKRVIVYKKSKRIGFTEEAANDLGLRENTPVGLAYDEDGKIYLILGLEGQYNLIMTGRILSFACHRVKEWSIQENCRLPYEVIPEGFHDHKTIRINDISA